MSSESPTKLGLDEASTPAQPERPPPKHILEGHEGWISSFVFLHDNIHIVSGSWDDTMRKWDCETGLLVGEPWKGEGGPIFVLALSPDGKTIACGREDGSLQRWNTNGEISDGVWMNHSNSVLSVSWSPNGGHIASGFKDGTILIRQAENGKVEVGPIRTEQHRVYSLAYSPSGDRIASGGDNTICIWDSNTGGLLVGPIYLGAIVSSVVWSSDSSKACVGYGDVARLWDTEFCRPLGKPFSLEDSTQRFNSVSFSLNGQYLAYGGDDEKIALWMVKDIAPELPEIQLQSSSSSLASEVDATNPVARPGGNDIVDGHDDTYDNFFQSSHSSLHSLSSGPSPIRRLWRFFVVSSPLRKPANVSVRPQERPKRPFFWRRARSPPSPLEAPANNELTPDGQVRAEEERNKDIDLPDSPEPSHPLEVGTNENSAGNKPNSLGDRVLHMEIPGQEHNDTEYREDFSRGISDSPQPRRGQRMGLVKRLFGVVKTLHSAPSPTPPMSSASPPITLRARLRHLLPEQPDHTGDAAPLVVDVPFAWGQLRHAAAGAPSNDNDLIPEEDYDLNSSTPREHESYRLWCCR